MTEREVVIVMFDLSIATGAQRSKYTKFIKYLKQLGFTMYQESIYVRLLKNSRNSIRIIDDILANAPQNGTVSAFAMRLRDFLLIKLVGDNGFDKHIFADDIVFI